MHNGDAYETNKKRLDKKPHPIKSHDLILQSRDEFGVGVASACMENTIKACHDGLTKPMQACVGMNRHSNRHTSANGSASCVQNFDDSLSSAIRMTYRISLRSSSLWEPRHPLLKVFDIIFVLDAVKREVRNYEQIALVKVD
jgi:hypothetical protein